MDLQVPSWLIKMFVPDAPLLESFVRGSVVYLCLLVLFRVILKRQSGSVGLPDIMLLVLVSECVSTSLSAEAKSVTNGLVVVAALLFWNYLIDRLCYRFPWLRRRLEPQPLQLVRNGKVCLENMATERITEEELRAKLREQGVDDVSKVKAAFVESEGTISVIPMK